MFGSVSQLGFGGRVWVGVWVRVRSRVMVRVRVTFRQCKVRVKFGLR